MPTADARQEGRGRHMLWVALFCVAIAVGIAVVLGLFPSIADHFTVAQLDSLFYLLDVLVLSWVLGLVAIVLLCHALRPLRRTALPWNRCPVWTSSIVSASPSLDGPVPRFLSLEI